MFNGRRELPQRSRHVKQDEKKFLPRFLSKEISSKAEPSFRVLYYGDSSGAVPFTWESQPGTPKHALSCETSLIPPLTPPPSYQSCPMVIAKSKHKFLVNVFPLRNSKKKHNLVSPVSFSSSSVSSSCSSSYSLPSTPMNPLLVRGRSCFLARSAGQFEVDEDAAAGGGGSPTSTLCFGVKEGSSGKGRRGMNKVKGKLLAIVGHVPTPEQVCVNAMCIIGKNPPSTSSRSSVNPSPLPSPTKPSSPSNATPSPKTHQPQKP
ncbi:hypothetical protein RJ639_005419 [Escallonia herrerae]|uniref:Uncharacterized protein n=1 Tax=Escallonia herrerae TaxID=1293975 RepID=A0AA89AU17_9ASTE|nr:hypothetical protein RJ639_005419 [Escallonia herrerae]